MLIEFWKSPVSFMLIVAFCQCIVFAPASDRLNSFKKNIGYLILAGLLIGIVMVLDYKYVDFNTSSTVLESIFVLLGSTIFLIYRHWNKMKQSIYSISWVYIIASLVSQIVMPIAYIIRLHSDTIWMNLLIFVIDMAFLVLSIFITIFLYDNYLWKGEKTTVSNQKILFSLIVLIVFIILSNYQFIFWLLGGEPESMSRMITLFRAIVAVGCLSLLFLQNHMENALIVEKDLELMKQLYYQQKDHYELSHKNIELINRKCHDIRHQMEAIRKFASEDEINKQLGELENSIMIYDSVIKTGNQVLDTVLTEKNLYCEKHGIQMTCMVDGSMLEFVDKIDLYTLFSNALDNAIESVIKQPDKDKRIIQVAVFHEKKLLMIRIRNYYEGDIQFEDDLPVSTKQDRDYHGIGLKSIRYTAEKYGGGIVCQKIDNSFSLQILLPIA
ncbi:MAG: GHKL domain-containing protein [Pseudobutyrivibrio ruminis]|nr:GHKL domain-containing protein [Pseudobutyrivibrio ruminis]